MSTDDENEEGIDEMLSGIIAQQIFNVFIRGTLEDSKCCIYKVPELFRNESVESYRPSVVSIGPAYYEDERLDSMQRLKEKFLEKFLQDTNRDLNFYINAVSGLNQDIRSCYEETLFSNDDDNDFIRMVVIDAIFLICFMRRVRGYYPLPPDVHPPNNLSVLLLIAKRDIFLEENQLPFFVLHKIYNLAFAVEHPSPIISLACEFIKKSSVFPGFVDVQRYAFPGVNANVDPSEIRHLLDLWRMGFSASAKNQHEPKPLVFPKTAKQLSAAGVKFIKRKDVLNPLSVKFNPNNGELQFPPFVVDTRTEAFLRNALIFEHCHYFSRGQPYFINLFFFLDSLIDNAEDIQLLTESGILKNLLGSEERAANFFNDITKHLDIVNSTYDLTSVSQDVNDYANKWRNRNMAILRRKYFSHPWAYMSFFFAIVVFTLTVLQTIFTIKK